MISLLNAPAHNQPYAPVPVIVAPREHGLILRAWPDRLRPPPFTLLPRDRGASLCPLSRRRLIHH
jgi:hypothetical protein